MTAQIRAADGRVLAYEEVGDPAGRPIFLLHGTPGCRLSELTLAEAWRVRDAGLRLIAYDRPGYGRSARDPGRRVVDCAADVAAIADSLRIERFAVVGGSGGGPHALAVGAELPDRVTRVGCLVGPAPFDAPGLDWFAGMDPVNVREAHWALAGEETLRDGIEPQVRDALDRAADDPLALYRKANLPESDWAVIDRPGFRDAVRVAIGEMYAQGASGWVDDTLAFVKPWGFDVGDLAVPVELRYGVEDVLVPAAHGEWLARNIPHASTIVEAGAGHMQAPAQRVEILARIAAA